MNWEDASALEALLPEYISGTLSAADTQRVREALEKSPELRAAYEREWHLNARIKSGMNMMADETDKNSRKRHDDLMKAAAADDAASSDAGKEKTTLAHALSFLSPKKWHPAISLSVALAVPLQAAVIAGQATAIASLEDENFRLASGPCPDESSKSSIIAEFSGDARWQDVAALLDDEELIIYKRGDFGVLTLRSKKEGTALNNQIERLKASPLVTSAAPAK